MWWMNMNKEVTYERTKKFTGRYTRKKSCIKDLAEINRIYKRLSERNRKCQITH